MLFYIKKYKNILVLIILGEIKMAVKTGVSMISFIITKEKKDKQKMNIKINNIIYIFMF